MKILGVTVHRIQARFVRGKLLRLKFGIKGVFTGRSSYLALVRLVAVTQAFSRTLGSPTQLRGGAVSWQLKQATASLTVESDDMGTGSIYNIWLSIR